MPFDQSQIGSWLKDVREARKLSRSKASLGAGIPEKQIQRWEIEGVSAPAEGFLTLVQFYGATKELAKLIGRWEKVSRSDADGAGEAGARRAG